MLPYFFIEPCPVDVLSALLGPSSEGDVVPDRSGLEPGVVGRQEDLVGGLEHALCLPQLSVQSRNLRPEWKG
jgi:hypothetical protein